MTAFGSSGPLGLTDGKESTEPPVADERKVGRDSSVIVKQWEFIYRGVLFLGGRDESGRIRAMRLSDSYLEARWFDWCHPDFRDDARLETAEKAEAAYRAEDWHYFDSVYRGRSNHLRSMAILPTTPFGKYNMPCGCKRQRASGCVNRPDGLGEKR